MKIIKRFRDWFSKQTTDQKIAVIGLVITFLSSIFIPLILFFFSPSNNSPKPSNTNSPVINQAPDSKSEINYNTNTNVIKGTDPRDIDIYLKKLKSKTKEDKFKEIDAFYASREIDSALKDSLYNVIEYIDENLQNTSKDIAVYRAQGRASLASSLEDINSAFIHGEIGQTQITSDSQSDISAADQAVIYANIAGKQSALLRYADAEGNYLKSIGLFEKAGLSNDPDYATVLNNLGKLYEKQDKSDLAESYYQKALDLKQKYLGVTNPAYANSLNNLAKLYRNQGKYTLAEPLYKQALEIRRNSLGTDHPDYAQSLINLAELYRNQGKYTLAEPLYKQALEIYKKTNGINNPEYAVALNNLALLYDMQARFDLAGPLYIDAVRIIKSILGANHPMTITIQNNYYEFQKAGHN